MAHNWEIKQKRLEWEEENELFISKCAEKNLDPERVRNLDMSADMADRLEGRKLRRRNVDVGFSTYADASHKKYLKLTKQIKPDLVAYQKEKEIL